MSHSPTDPAELAGDSLGDSAGSSAGNYAGNYAAGWAAINRLVRQGGSWSGREANAAFLNIGTHLLDGGEPAFSDVAPVLGLDHKDDSRSAAVLDLDFDGDEDLVVTARTAPRVRLYSNRLADGAHHLALRVAGRSVNADGIGAVVRVTPVSPDDGTPVGPVQRRTRRAGHGYLAQSSAWLRFGLGRGEETPHVRVSVAWPRLAGAEPGQPEDFGVLRADRRYVLVEGTGAARQASAPSVPSLTPSALTAAFEPAEAARIVLAAPLPVPSLPVETSSGAEGLLFGVTPGGPKGTGQPVLLVAWASWCAPCQAELGRLQAAATELLDAGVQVFALALDDEETSAAASRALKTLGWTFPSFQARGTTSETLDAVLAHVRDRPVRMPIPTAFLFQPDGALAVIYVGGATPEQVALDARLATSPIGGRRSFAALGAGRWRAEPRGADVTGLRGRLAARGLTAPLRELELAAAVTRSGSPADLHASFGEARARQERFEDALRHFDDALAIEPGHAGALRGRAESLQRLERFAEAADAWRAAVDAEPDALEPRFRLGLALAQAGDLERAGEALRVLRARTDPRAAELAAALDEAITAAARKGAREGARKGDGETANEKGGGR